MTINDNQVWAVVYEVSRNYGGPEEGGWWFDSGNLVESKVFGSEAAADAQCEQWRNGDYARTGNRYSVLGGEDYDCYWTNEEPEEFFPTERPHYE